MQTCFVCSASLDCSDRRQTTQTPLRFGGTVLHRIFAFSGCCSWAHCFDPIILHVAYFIYTQSYRDNSPHHQQLKQAEITSPQTMAQTPSLNQTCNRTSARACMPAQAGRPVGKQASEPASEQASKRPNEQTRKQASKQESRQTSKQIN